MDRELIEKKIRDIQEEIRKLIDDAYICGYKDGYLECTCHKGMVMNESSQVIYKDTPSNLAISIKHMGGM